MSKHLIVIGGGAAGFFCAVNAARLCSGLRVTILEKSNKLLSKVRISGGGRCNVTHACFDITEMSSRYPRGKHFVKKSFHQFFTNDTVAWFEERGVMLKTEEDGRMFPVTDSSQTITDCLLKEAAKYDVDIRKNAEVISIEKPGKFSLRLHNGEKLEADYLCIAAGGYAKADAFNWIRETGHSIEDPVPSLFTFNIPLHPVTKLMGISVENASIAIAGTKMKTEGPVLITHWGMGNQRPCSIKIKRDCCQGTSAAQL
jgi:predicted Rossmann fold flavoprotein